MDLGKKKGLSPVVATILLVSLALVLALIVFLWARSFFSEAISKQDKKVELWCEDVAFSAEAFGEPTLSSANSPISLLQISVKNEGNVPIYGIEIRTKRIVGEITKVATFNSLSIYAGETKETDNIDVGGENLKIGDELLIVPILLGETPDYRKAYVCDKAYGKDIIIKERPV